MMRVLFISHSSNLYGAERSLLLLLKNINRELFDPIVIIPRDGPLKKRILQLNIKVYKVRMARWVPDKMGIVKFADCAIFGIITLCRLYYIIKREKIDVIYTNTIVNFSGAFAAFFAKKPHIWHIREILHGNPDLNFFMPYKVLFKFILKMSQLVIANSNATARQFRGLNQDYKIKIVHNTVDFERFKHSAPFPSIDGITKADWLVAVIGTLQKRKAQDDAMRTIKIIKETIPNIKLLLIGGGNSAYISYLKKVVSELDISKYVIFTGYREDIPEILSYCKVLLAPSLLEPFGRVAIEAMAAGIPVIGANTGGLKEIIEDGVTGYIVSPKAYSEIAKKIIDLFRHPDKAQRMGEAGKKIAEQKFCITKYIQSIESFIQETAIIKNEKKQRS